MLTGAVLKIYYTLAATFKGGDVVLILQNRQPVHCFRFTRVGRGGVTAYYQLCGRELRSVSGDRKNPRTTL